MPHSLDYVFRDVARHLNVDFSYVEKDWYAVKVLSVISELDVPIVFTGGTSLSKGHGLIERFSEDLDFRICLKDKLSRKKRREIRSKIFNAINSIHDISVLEETISSKNEGKFFSANVSYPKFFSLKESLRSNLKLEFSFEPVELDITFEEIRSFVNEYLLEYTDDQPDIDCKIKTISPIETGANKYSALIWRIFVRDRSAKEGSAKNDSTMVRHLHDLFALKNLLLKIISSLKMMNLQISTANLVRLCNIFYLF